MQFFFGGRRVGWFVREQESGSMYIKQVIIQGFRSYRDQTIIEPFSPKHNVIIGRNGSGKSNFFFAIQFVLSDEFSHMRPEERQQLLHEGTGPRVVTAFVEMIFDNTGSRIPIDSNEVSIKRAIGAKKDSYYLDKKHVTKSDVMNLLESAGFSRSNPYYIVKQGKINQLALSPDSQRLKLLREVAGTRVYDERKEESKGILKETEGKRDKIEEMIGYIEERLSTLEEEKEELKAYQEWDKMRRSLEYTIHDKELRDTREKLEALEESRKESKEGSKERDERLAAARTEIESLERELKEGRSSLQALSSEKKQLLEDADELMARKAALEVAVSDLDSRVEEERGTKESSLTELATLENRIEETQMELDSVLPRFQSQRDEEEKLNSLLKTNEQRRAELFAKQGRGQQFSSTKERDSWIKKEAKSLSTSIDAKEKQIKKLTKDVETLKSKMQQQESELKERSEDVAQRHTAIDKASREYAQLKLKRDDLTNQRKEIWRKEAALDHTLQSVRLDLGNAERDLKSTASRNTMRGIDSVMKIAADRELTGVHGPLLEVFTCEPKVFTAVEVTAGNRLFHIVVDTDRTASQILSTMNRNKMGGEVTFLPLNKLQPPNPRYPTSKDAIPMVQHLKFNPMFKAAIMQVFGKTLICRDMDKASQFAKTADMDCITLEGDEVSRKGTLTGGYYDSRRSRLDIQRQIVELKERLEATQGEKDQLGGQIDELDGQITHVMGDLQKVESKLAQLKETFERQKVDTRSLEREQQANSRAIEPKARALANLESDCQSLHSALSSLEAELGTELLSQLDVDDQGEVEQLTEDIQSLQRELRTCLQQRTALETKKVNLENGLTNNLLKTKAELQRELAEISHSDKMQQLEVTNTELSHLDATIKQNQQRYGEVQSSLDAHSKTIKVQDKALDKWRTVEREQQESISEESKQLEKLASKRSLLLNKKEDSMRKIRELGSLPSDAFEKFMNLTLSQLWKKLHKCNTELKKYSHVNKKALEQFVNFSERKEKLTSRKEQLDKDYHSIEELMDVLEQRKHEAIQLTFKQVTAFFSEVFQELVPDGKAVLKMKHLEASAAHLSADSDSLSASASSIPPSEMYTGVSIEVSFSGRSSETKELQQLSGGQKSLVALAMIFAIQKCDPAPFYLFDEIDQALDSHHRHSVAAMIHRLAETAQFITTTFRPELLESADKFYGVTFQNKVSHISCVSKEAAAGFIEEETADK